jgi:hypothetical protein
MKRLGESSEEKPGKKKTDLNDWNSTRNHTRIVTSRSLQSDRIA